MIEYCCVLKCKKSQKYIIDEIYGMSAVQFQVVLKSFGLESFFHMQFLQAVFLFDFQSKVKVSYETSHDFQSSITNSDPYFNIVHSISTKKALASKL
jgi:hypothetical protein